MSGYKRTIWHRHRTYGECGIVPVFQLHERTCKAGFVSRSSQLYLTSTVFVEDGLQQCTALNTISVNSSFCSYKSGFDKINVLPFITVMLYLSLSLWNNSD